ncbi:MAG: hypothetical protein ACP5UA_06130 [Candidatus Hydrogenedens sp.]
MDIQDIIKVLGIEVVVKGEKTEIGKVFAGDRISDLIHSASENTLIITHLNHISLVQLFNIFDVPAICLITDSEPIHELIESAEENKAFLLVSSLEMYETCGVIYGIFEKGKIQQ